MVERHRTSLGLTVVLVITLVALGASFSVFGAERDLTVSAPDGVILNGVLSVPERVEGDAPAVRHPVVILIHHHGRTRESLIPLSDALVAAGFATLTMDTRGHGQSVRTEKQTIYAFPLLKETELHAAVGDQALVLAQLAGQPDLDPERVAFVGVGWGGLIAAEAAARTLAAKSLVVVDPPEPVADFDPLRDLGLFGNRPALLLCSSYPASRERARLWAEYGLGERAVRCVDAYEQNDGLLTGGSPAVAELVTWIAGQLGSTPR